MDAQNFSDGKQREGELKDGSQTLMWDIILSKRERIENHSPQVFQHQLVQELQNYFQGVVRQSESQEVWWHGRQAHPNSVHAFYTKH